MEDDMTNQGITGGLRTTLRLEGLAELAVAVLLYAHLSGNWGVFGLTFFAPDIAFIGYLANARIGGLAYNATHSHIGPALLGVLGLLAAPSLVPFALIWFAHIGFDRALGYGLKSVSGFKTTHLGTIGHAAA
jgi:hypothetical protein